MLRVSLVLANFNKNIYDSNVRACLKLVRRTKYLAFFFTGYYAKRRLRLFLKRRRKRFRIHRYRRRLFLFRLVLLTKNAAFAFSLINNFIFVAAATVLNVVARAHLTTLQQLPRGSISSSKFYPFIRHLLVLKLLFRDRLYRCIRNRRTQNILTLPYRRKKLRGVALFRRRLSKLFFVRFSTIVFLKVFFAAFLGKTIVFKCLYQAFIQRLLHKDVEIVIQTINQQTDLLQSPERELSANLKSFRNNELRSFDPLQTFAQYLRFSVAYPFGTFYNFYNYYIFLKNIRRFYKSRREAAVGFNLRLFFLSIVFVNIQVFVDAVASIISKTRKHTKFFDTWVQIFEKMLKVSLLPVPKRVARPSRTI